MTVLQQETVIKTHDQVVAAGSSLDIYTALLLQPKSWKYIVK
jgi:hypothetical protein